MANRERTIKKYDKQLHSFCKTVFRYVSGINKKEHDRIQTAKTFGK